MKWALKGCIITSTLLHIYRRGGREYTIYCPAFWHINILVPNGTRGSPGLGGTFYDIGGYNFYFLWIDIKTYKNMSKWKSDKNSWICNFFYSLTQLSYFFMIHLVIFGSTNM